MVEISSGTPSVKCLSKWINVDKWDYFKNCSQDFLPLLYFNFQLFFRYETIVSSSSAWSFGHSDPDPSSAQCRSFQFLGLCLHNNFSSVVEFQRCWVLKSMIFGQEWTNSKVKKFEKLCQWMSVHQKLSMI